jgi:uncharacterized membrane protein YcaP (DUF421 family)
MGISNKIVQNGRVQMLDMSIGVVEHIARAAIVFTFLFISLRFVGKKHVGELAPFDLVALLILSETVQNAMVGDDKSVTGGLVSAATLIVLIQLLSFVSSRSKRLERLIEGTPKVLVRHGHRCKEVMAQEQISISELIEAMRREGCSNISDIRVALLENDGRISILKRVG